MCSTTAKLNRVLLVACFYLFLIKSLLLKRKKMDTTKAASALMRGCGPFLSNLANRMKQFFIG